MKSEPRPIFCVWVLDKKRYRKLIAHPDHKKKLQQLIRRDVCVYILPPGMVTSKEFVTQAYHLTRISQELFQEIWFAGDCYPESAFIEEVVRLTPTGTKLVTCSSSAGTALDWYLRNVVRIEAGKRKPGEQPKFLGGDDPGLSS